MQTDNLVIATFRAEKQRAKAVNPVKLTVRKEETNFETNMNVYAVPKICGEVKSQDIESAKRITQIYRTRFIPSLNDCLNVGPALSPKIFDILVRFRQYRAAVVADIEKAFLNIGVEEIDRDVLRFL